MILPWREHEEAGEELMSAALWYEDRLEGLGESFVDAVEAAVNSIRDPSIKWSYYLGVKRVPQVYSRSVGGFPFDVIYVEIDDDINVVAYAHERRRPGYWMPRLRK
jgi:hypothetical protein